MTQWRKVKLGDICSLITDGKHGDCKDQENSGYYFISAKDIKDGSINYSNARQIVKEDFTQTDRRTNLGAGDILITNSGTIGRMAIVKDISETRKTTFQKSVAILKPNKVFSNFLYYAIQANISALIALAGGTTQQNLLLGDIRPFEIGIPSKFEQKRIADILSGFDDKIELNRKMCKTLESMAQALFKSWFVDFEPVRAKIEAKAAGRDPELAAMSVISGKSEAELRSMPKEQYKELAHTASLFPDELVASELGPIPKGWAWGTIGTLASRIFSGGTPNTSKKEYWGGILPWLSSGETRNNFVIKTEKTITENGVANSSTRLAHKHDIVMASAGQGLTRGQTSYLLLDTYINQSVIVISSEVFRQPYIYFNLSNRYEELRGISDASSIRGSLTTKMISQFPLLIAPDGILKQYAETVMPYIDKIESISKTNDVLSQMRDELLRELMDNKEASL